MGMSTEGNLSYLSDTFKEQLNFNIFHLILRTCHIFDVCHTFQDISLKMTLKLLLLPTVHQVKNVFLMLFENCSNLVISSRFIHTEQKKLILYTNAFCHNKQRIPHKAWREILF